MQTLTKTTEQDRANAERTIARSLKFSQQQREHARTMIDPAGILTQIFEMDTMITPTLQINGEFTPPTRDMLAAVGKRLDLRFKLLNKALPDLKSTEITGIIDHNHTMDVGKMSDIELAQRFVMWATNQQSIANTENVIDVTPVTQQAVPTEHTSSESAEEYPFI